eukprot:TRINITY_DN3391_c0_g1_i2.p1 TRINITY_DN3391_c0_g1~~TRINITY_DN3391_c0_g1_i2.p1  ORF type:complete len:449 (+),score=71.22 TRINITY_DN3391_c0_g1_i2:81-1427(+)
MSSSSKQNKMTSTPHGKEPYEFGGPLGVTFIMVISHLLLFYIWLCFEYYQGQVAIVPLSELWNHVKEGIWPTFFAFKLYFGFFLFQLVTAALVPGFYVTSAPRVDRPGKGERLVYNCNALYAWYITLVASLVSQYFQLFDFGSIVRNLGPLTIMSILFADGVALLAYISARVTGNTFRMSGNVIYDFFIGLWLHPRIGPIDLKMFGEIRWSWFILFNITFSSVVHQYQTYNTVSTPLIFMLVAHFLYANACAKGEDLVTPSWDIVYEKWGWLLIFWNFAGVPFLYCSSSVYLAKIPPFSHHPLYTTFCFVLLFVGYYIFDTANAQKNSFRMRTADPSWKPRRTFPQLPFAYLNEKAKHLKTKTGSRLLIDGWWAYARKPHYTGDLMMAASWGLITGFDSFLPYIYVLFFFSMLLHRRIRDEERMRAKYKQDWDLYTSKVPYIYVPRVF